jgi:DNA-binding CsgD family transcriptional regulator
VRCSNGLQLGFISKAESNLQTINSVLFNGDSLDHSGLNVTRVKGEERTSGPRLSGRQQECLRGVLQLKSAKEIARDLGVSQHAVEKYLRICRDKYGVSSTAEAARIFSRQQEGGETPHYGSSDLAPRRAPVDEGGVRERRGEASFGQLEDSTGALSLDHPLTPRQTLLTIAAVSFASIVGLLLLVACAEAIRSLVSR